LLDTLFQFCYKGAVPKSFWEKEREICYLLQKGGDHFLDMEEGSKEKAQKRKEK
jgi:hypothetical protein